MHKLHYIHRLRQYKLSSMKGWKFKELTHLIDPQGQVNRHTKLCKENLLKRVKMKANNAFAELDATQAIILGLNINNANQLSRQVCRYLHCQYYAAFCIIRPTIRQFKYKNKLALRTKLHDPITRKDCRGRQATSQLIFRYSNSPRCTDRPKKNQKTSDYQLLQNSDSSSLNDKGRSRIQRTTNQLSSLQKKIEVENKPSTAISASLCYSSQAPYSIFTKYLDKIARKITSETDSNTPH